MKGERERSPVLVLLLAERLGFGLVLLRDDTRVLVLAL